LTRTPVRVAIVVIALIVLVGVGYGVVRARSGGSGTGLPAASPSPSPTGASAPSPTPAAVPRWQVAKAVGPVVAYTAPSTSAAVRQRFSAVNVNGFPSIFLVRSVRQVGAATWYDVWLPIRPNESHGWIREGGVAIYSTVAKIVINLAKRRLSVYRRGVLMGTFRVAVRRASTTSTRNSGRRPSAAPTAFWLWASAPSSRGCRTGLRVARWPSTAPTRTR
jgi:hypothetical protein